MNINLSAEIACHKSVILIVPLSEYYNIPLEPKI